MPCSKIINRNYSVLGENLDISAIPEPPKNRIAYVDGYGNMKLTTSSSDMELDYSSHVNIKIGKAVLQGKYVEGMFGIKEGEISVAPGSSGPKDDRFIEISVRLGNAWEKFGCPKLEEKIEISRL